MIRDKVLTGLVEKQTEAFNRDAPMDEKVTLFEKIQKRQAELKLLNNS